MLELIDKVKSEVDNVTKYVFRLAGRRDIVEFSYIDNGTGKDIICVSCLTMCNLKCKFCHCTDYVGKIVPQALFAMDIASGVEQIVEDLKEKKDVLLISYMGCGEPLNLEGNELILSMEYIREELKCIYKSVRFGLATCLPRARVPNFFKFCEDVRRLNIPVKLHLSLHYVEDNQREAWMPASLDIKSSIAACNFFKQYTGNKVEIHYTLIEGVNDRLIDAIDINDLIGKYDFNLKIITYNEKESLRYKASRRAEGFLTWIPDVVEKEIYTPPGRDIGSSCGQFLFETYEKYAKGDK